MAGGFQETPQASAWRCGLAVRHPPGSSPAWNGASWNVTGPQCLLRRALALLHITHQLLEATQVSTHAQWAQGTSSALSAWRQLTQSPFDLTLWSCGPRPSPASTTSQPGAQWAI